MAGRVPGKQTTQQGLDTKEGTKTSLPAADTEVSHTLGVKPSMVILTEKTGTVEDTVFLKTKSATSITIKAGTSGVDVKWKLIK